MSISAARKAHKGAPNYRLRDMLVLGAPPPKLFKALAVIAEQLHPTFARQPWIAHRNKSKESCVMCSLAVRDFLLSIGFIDAQVRPCATLMRATRGGVELHSLGIGVPRETEDDPGRWNGHLVVTAAGHLIDTTLYPTRRRQWRKLPGMFALPFRTVDPEPYAYGLHPFAYTALLDDEIGYRFDLIYLDAPYNTGWRDGGDALPERREAVIAAMRKRFGRWEPST